LIALNTIYGLDRNNGPKQYPNEVEQLSPPFLRAAQATPHCFDGVFDSVMLTETLYSLSSSNSSTRIEVRRGSSTTSIMVIQTLIRPSFSKRLHVFPF